MIAGAGLRALAFTCALIVAFPVVSRGGGSIVAKRAALSTASPVATRVGLNVLQQGGNAADAAVAVALALSVTYPQAGNLGGGGLLVYYDAKSGGVWTLDFLETAPRTAVRDMFAAGPGISRTGALAAGVPGTVAGLDALHQRFGSRPWAELVAPAAALAREGLATGEELRSDLAAAKTDRSIDQFPATAALFYENGRPREAIAPADLAKTLMRLAEKGARDFYEGDIAKAIIESLRAGGGIIGFRDLADYAPVWRAPIRLRYGDYDLYMAPPPSSGGLVVGEALNILSGDDLASLGFQKPATLHLIVEAQRRAFIDRNRYLADPLSARIPYRELLSKKRAERWRATIHAERAIATVNLAEPVDAVAEGEHTTHFTVADAEGNVVSLTTSLGENFGSGFVLPGLGFLLNNAMDGFTTAAGRANGEGLVQGISNAVDPSKRPASSLSPTIVLRNGKPFLALGTGGGPAIPTTILQVFLNIASFGKPAVEAIDAPRYHHQALPEELRYETGRAPGPTVDALNAMGHGVKGMKAIGDVHAILFDEGQMIAVADPRRGGAAGGF